MSFYRIGKAQHIGLLKLAAFCRNPLLTEPRQEELRAKSLETWRIPDIPKVPIPRLTTDNLLQAVVQNPGKIYLQMQFNCNRFVIEFMLVNPLEVRDLGEFQNLALNVREWYVTHLSCRRKPNICNIYVGE